MSVTAAKSQLVKVFCESCLKQFAEDCIICGGAKFYLWDPETALCYVPSGEPMLAENSAGELVGVVRRKDACGRARLSLEHQLEFIELWISEDPRRKWKMWLDGGWNCCFWLNRYKAEAVHLTAPDAVSCVDACYRKILELTGGGAGRHADPTQDPGRTDPGGHD